MDFLPKDRSEVSASAQLLLRDYAGHRWPTGNHKFRMTRLASVLGLSFRRTRAIYQGDPAVRLRADEMQRIEALRGEQEASNVRDSQAEYRALEARIASLEALFAAGDEEHGRPHLDALRSLASRPGPGPSFGGEAHGPARFDDDPFDFTD